MHCLGCQEGLSFEEGLALIKKAIHELSVRFLIAQPKFIIKVRQRGDQSLSMCQGVGQEG